MEAVLPIMSQFPEIETCVEVSWQAGGTGVKRKGRGQALQQAVMCWWPGTSAQVSCHVEGRWGPLSWVGAADHLCLHLCRSSFESPGIRYLSESVLVAPSAQPRT